MKVLVSSKILAEKLKLLPLDEVAMQQAGVESTICFSDSLLTNSLLFLIAKNTITIPVYVIEHGEPVTQMNRRWDLVRDLVSSVKEQPIVLEIKEHCVNVIFQY